MLLKYLRSLLKRPALSGGQAQPDGVLLDHANKLMFRGDNRGAIKAFRDYLKSDPFNVSALNDLAACLADIGDVGQAASMFELAYSLDDTFIPAMVNHAKLLNDNRRAGEAIPFLERAKISQPTIGHADAVYAGVLLKKGDVARARRFQLRSWLANFDNLRLANCYMFWSGYDEIDEADVAAEHRFWAETLLPFHTTIARQGTEAQTQAHDRRLRIGYLSSDFRNHSVRYFSRPLIENHDHKNFEVFIYHDFPGADWQTEQFKQVADQFHVVCEMTDVELHAFICSHELDVLVDLAGHTSFNRLAMLQAHMAKVQMTALGYPLTTGLRSVDAKLLDCHVVTPDSGRYYAETPAIMPSSFWCFDPAEDAPVAEEPPVVANKYVTFGCVGNIAKITPRILRAWRQILEAIPSSRLLLRSINFDDPIGIDATRSMLEAHGLPASRVDLCMPEGGTAFFDSYNSIDIILDTFPFNGGTTTCFATYMGVPVVSLTGESLLSRMGLSILTNLGARDLAVRNDGAYVARAIDLAGDLEFLRRFKREARGLYKRSALGNGKIFAREFEQVCVDLLARAAAGTLAHEDEIGFLPADEIMRRAYAVAQTGQTAATQRILSHCLDAYPNAGSAYLLQAQLWTWDGLYAQAIGYLTRHLVDFSVGDRISARLAIVRLQLLLDDRSTARATMAELSGMVIEDKFDHMQAELYEACLAECAEAGYQSPAAAMARTNRIQFLIPCDSRTQFEAMRRQIRETCYCPPGWTVAYQRCDEAARLPAYRAAMSADEADILVVAQKNVQIWHPRFLLELESALSQADLVGFAGATRWSRLDWRFDDFQCKAGAFMGPSSEKAGFAELHLLGAGRSVCMDGMSVLDGRLLAMRTNASMSCDFDEELLSCGTLAEEAWTHEMSKKNGCQLVVHRNLGVFIDPSIELDSRNQTEARLRWANAMGFDAFAEFKDDHIALSVPITRPADAVRICNAYLEAGA